MAGETVNQVATNAKVFKPLGPLVAAGNAVSFEVAALYLKATTAAATGEAGTVNFCPLYVGS